MNELSWVSRIAASFLGLLACLPAKAEQGRGAIQPGVLELPANQQVEKLFQAADFPALEALTRKWKSELPPAVQKQILIVLLRKLRSDRKLALGSPPRVLVTGHDPDENQDAHKAGKGIIRVRQNVFTEGGRSAWAIEQMLSRPLPVLHWPVGEDDKSRFHQRYYEVVIMAMNLPNELRSELEKLSVKERVKLAGQGSTPPSVLTGLAKDGNAQVRLAVAQNSKTSLRTLYLLSRDPDPQVREAADKNLIPARLEAP